MCKNVFNSLLILGCLFLANKSTWAQESKVVGGTEEVVVAEGFSDPMVALSFGPGLFVRTSVVEGLRLPTIPAKTLNTPMFGMGGSLNLGVFITSNFYVVLMGAYDRASVKMAEPLVLNNIDQEVISEIASEQETVASTMLTKKVANVVSDFFQNKETSDFVTKTFSNIMKSSSSDKAGETTEKKDDSSASSAAVGQDSYTMDANVTVLGLKDNTTLFVESMGVGLIPMYKVLNGAFNVDFGMGVYYSRSVYSGGILDALRGFKWTANRYGVKKFLKEDEKKEVEFAADPKEVRGESWIHHNLYLMLKLSMYIRFNNMFNLGINQEVGFNVFHASQGKEIADEDSFLLQIHGGCFKNGLLSNTSLGIGISF